MGLQREKVLRNGRAPIAAKPSSAPFENRIFETKGERGEYIKQRTHELVCERSWLWRQRKKALGELLDALGTQGEEREKITAAFFGEDASFYTKTGRKLAEEAREKIGEALGNGNASGVARGAWEEYCLFEDMEKEKNGAIFELNKGMYRSVLLSGMRANDIGQDEFDDISAIAVLTCLRCIERYDSATGYELSTFIKSYGQGFMVAVLLDRKGGMSYSLDEPMEDGSDITGVQTLADERPTPDSNAERSAHLESIRGIVEAALPSMTEPQKQVVELHLWEGLNFEEIGRIRGTTRENSRTLYDRGLANMLKRIRAGGKEGDVRILLRALDGLVE